MLRDLLISLRYISRSPRREQAHLLVDVVSHVVPVALEEAGRFAVVFERELQLVDLVDGVAACPL